MKEVDAEDYILYYYVYIKMYKSRETERLVGVNSISIKL